VNPFGQGLIVLALRVRQCIEDLPPGIERSTPLGKIEVSGPGALGFLEWVYAGALADLKPGRGRYGLMLREDGRLFDDGVAFRLSSCHFWVSTTAGNADSVYAWLEYLRQRLWKGAAVFLVPVTAQWANAVVCGPRAHELLAAVSTDIDLSRASMPFMSFRDGTVAGLPARVFRVSFTGELSFEINVPASDGLALWEALQTAGGEFRLHPVGSEANHVLRIEKGYISIAHEADGIASPDDLGLGWAVRFAKHDFIGRRSLQRMNATQQPRCQLVGLLTDEPKQVLAEGAQIIALVPGRPMRSAGHVTASVMSPALGRSIALALLDNGRQRFGERVQVTVEAAKGLSETTALVVQPVFYDPDGVRLHG
jgi:sarcosine oxidase, subunit alpha